MSSPNFKLRSFIMPSMCWVSIPNPSTNNRRKKNYTVIISHVSVRVSHSFAF